MPPASRQRTLATTQKTIQEVSLCQLHRVSCPSARGLAPTFQQFSCSTPQRGNQAKASGTPPGCRGPKIAAQSRPDHDDRKPRATLTRHDSTNMLIA
ncbi:hypothetical protein VTN96DRAFT_9184 [Rasamsonia emersonii]